MNPISDPIVQLLETPFRRWKRSGKMELLKQGKPTPELSSLQMKLLSKNRDQQRNRYFNSHWYKTSTWLCGSHYKQALFCWPCLLLNRKKTVWNTTGYCDLNNLLRDIKTHEFFKEHITSIVELKTLENKIETVPDSLTERDILLEKIFKENVRLNRLFMENMINIVLVLGRPELAFREHDETSSIINEDSFRQVFEMLIVKCSLEIKNHFKSIKNELSGLFNTIPNDLITCISDHILNCIKSEIEECMFFSVQVDNTRDIFQKTQCSITIRYLTKKSELVERFLGFFDVLDNHHPEGLYNLLTCVLSEFDVQNKLVGQCYDGACVMADHVNNLQTSVQEIAPSALFTHSLAHQLNIVLQHGCSVNTQCRIFFANLDGILSFCHSSTSRTTIVDKIVRECNIPVQTDWTSRSKFLNVLVTKWREFKTVFETVIKDPNSSSELIFGSIAHLKNLNSFHFAFLAQTFSSIFLHTDHLFITLQNNSFDMKYCSQQINAVIDLIKKEKNNVNEFLKLFHNAVALSKTPKETRNMANSKLSFESLYFEILENILVQIITRFQNTNKLLFLQLADVPKFKCYTTLFPKSAFKNLKLSCSNKFFDMKKLKVELKVIYSNQTYQSLHHAYDLIKIIERDRMKEILPEVYKLFSLILTLPSTSISDESSFSCRKRIETNVPNTIYPHKLRPLAIISIEKELLEHLKNTKGFYDKIINIYSNQNNNSIDLQYQS